MGQRLQETGDVPESDLTDDGRRGIGKNTHFLHKNSEILLKCANHKLKYVITYNL